MTFPVNITVVIGSRQCTNYQRETKLFDIRGGLILLASSNVHVTTKLHSFSLPLI